MARPVSVADPFDGQITRNENEKKRHERFYFADGNVIFLVSPLYDIMAMSSPPFSIRCSSKVLIA
jgi:hypothetical protein